MHKKGKNFLLVSRAGPTSIYIAENIQIAGELFRMKLMEIWNGNICRTCHSGGYLRSDLSRQERTVERGSYRQKRKRGQKMKKGLMLMRMGEDDNDEDD